MKENNVNLLQRAIYCFNGWKWHTSVFLAKYLLEEFPRKKNARYLYESVTIKFFIAHSSVFLHPRTAYLSEKEYWKTSPSGGACSLIFGNLPAGIVLHWSNLSSPLWLKVKEARGVPHKKDGAARRKNLRTPAKGSRTCFMGVSKIHFHP